MFNKKTLKKEVDRREFLGVMYFQDETGLVYGQHFAVLRLHSLNGLRKYASDQYISLN